MDHYIVNGGNPLSGEVEIAGAKNAALGILAASVMTSETVTVENTGDFDIEDVVQFYIKDTSPDAVPNHSLCGFSRVSLKKGEKKTVSVKIEDRSFTAVHEDGTRSIDGKEFTLYAGISQPDELSRKLTGTETVSVKINK